MSVPLHMALQLVGAARVGLPIRPRLRRWPDPLTLEVTAGSVGRSSSAASPDTAYFTLLAIAGELCQGCCLADGLRRLLAAVALGGRAVRDGGAARVLSSGGQATERSSPRSAGGYRLRVHRRSAAVVPHGVFASPIADILANGQLRVGDLIQALAGCLVVLAWRSSRAGLHRVGRASACSPGSTSEVPASPPCWRSASRWPGACRRCSGSPGPID